MDPDDDVALNILELRLRLFHGELLVSARLLKYLPTRCDATKGAARRHRFDIGIEQLFRRLEIMCGDSLDELTCPGELHQRNLTPANRVFKQASIGRRSTEPGLGPEPPLRTGTSARGEKYSVSVDHSARRLRRPAPKPLSEGRRTTLVGS